MVAGHGAVGQGVGRETKSTWFAAGCATLRRAAPGQRLLPRPTWRKPPRFPQRALPAGTP